LEIGQAQRPKNFQLVRNAAIEGLLQGSENQRAGIKKTRRRIVRALYGTCGVQNLSNPAVGLRWMALRLERNALFGGRLASRSLRCSHCHGGRRRR
jgi:hypothetical protein